VTNVFTYRFVSSKEVGTPTLLLLQGTLMSLRLGTLAGDAAARHGA
jgi:hypothetical protein